MLFVFKIILFALFSGVVTAVGATLVVMLCSAKWRAYFEEMRLSEGPSYAHRREALGR